jgi:hypothetical protein
MTLILPLLKVIFILWDVDFRKKIRKAKSVYFSCYLGNSPGGVRYLASERQVLICRRILSSWNCPRREKKSFGLMGPRAKRAIGK